MILYHGSNTQGIALLEPHLADHDRPYVYMTTIETVALFYLCNAVERPYYWFPYGFTRRDVEQNNFSKPIYEELYPNALREVSEGVRGCIYRVEATEEQVLPFQNIPCARLATAPMPVLSCTEVVDAYALLLDFEKQGKLAVRRFEEQTPARLEWWWRALRHYLREKRMLLTPDCSYARFVRAKFPWVWEQYAEEERRSPAPERTHPPAAMQ